MDEDMLKIAQDEYQRQYYEWLANKPKEKDIFKSIEMLIEKYTEMRKNVTGK